MTKAVLGISRESPVIMLISTYAHSVERPGSQAAFHLA